MKNPSIAAAGVLVVLALVVGGLALASGDDQAGDDASVLTASAPAPKASFETLSPRELRKKANLEEAKRELEKVKKIGTEVAPGTFKVVDENGEATFYHGELLPGFGRGGEPLYLTAQFKKVANVPLKKRKEMPAGALPKFKKDPESKVGFEKPKGDDDKDSEKNKPLQSAGGG